MKNRFLALFFSVIGMVFGYSCNKDQKSDFLQFDLNGKCTISFSNLNESPLHINFEKWSTIPTEFIEIDTILEAGINFSIELKNHSMDYINVNLNKRNFDIFLIPGSNDSLIFIGNDSLLFTGSLSPINNFLFQNSKNKLGLNSLNHARAMAVHSEKNFDRLISITDSLFQLQLENLNANSTLLPEWYVSMETERLAYLNVGSTLNSISYRRNMLKIEDSIPKGFIENLVASVTLGNENFIGESNYMLFLNDYFNHIGLKNGRNKKENIDQPFIISFAEELDEKLTGNVKDAFLAFRTTMLIKHVRTEYDPGVLDYFSDEFWSDFIEDYYLKSVTLNPGTKSPYFFLQDRIGRDVESRDYLGNILIINFWADWCKPCIEEFPYENALVEKYKEKPVKILNVCLDSNPEKWKEYIDKYNLKMENLFADTVWSKKLKNDFDVLGIPHSVLIDWNGNIVENRVESASRGVDKKIDTLLLKMEEF